MLEEYICRYCGKKFVTRKREKSRIIKFCSKECYHKSLQKIVFCEECGKQILYNKNNKRTNKHFCSVECSIKNRQKGLSPEHKENISKSLKGKPLSDELKQKLSNAKKGKPIKHFIENSEEIRNKISKALTGKPQPWNRGENHFNYNPNSQHKERNVAYGRVEYKNWRKKVFERDNYTCQRCGKRGVELNAHHTIPWAINEKERYNIENGITLCIECHKLTDSYGNKIKKNYML